MLRESRRHNRPSDSLLPNSVRLLVCLRLSRWDRACSSLCVLSVLQLTVVTAAVNVFPCQCGIIACAGFFCLVPPTSRALLAGRTHHTLTFSENIPPHSTPLGLISSIHASCAVCRVLGHHMNPFTCLLEVSIISFCTPASPIDSRPFPYIHPLPFPI